MSAETKVDCGGSGWVRDKVTTGRLRADMLDPCPGPPRCVNANCPEDEPAPRSAREALDPWIDCSDMDDRPSPEGPGSPNDEVACPNCGFVFWRSDCPRCGTDTDTGQPVSKEFQPAGSTDDGDEWADSAKAEHKEDEGVQVRTRREAGGVIRDDRATQRSAAAGGEARDSTSGPVGGCSEGDPSGPDAPSSRFPDDGGVAGESTDLFEAARNEIARLRQRLRDVEEEADRLAHAGQLLGEDVERLEVRADAVEERERRLRERVVDVLGSIAAHAKRGIEDGNRGVVLNQIVTLAGTQRTALRGEEHEDGD